MAIAQRPLALRRDLIRIFGEDRLVAVIRTATPGLARDAARAMSEAGVRLVEITLTIPDAFELISDLANDDAFAARGSIVGAGTVLNGTQAEESLLAGARFLVSPILVPEMIAAARARDAMSMPGTMTPTEMVRAAELGADFIKVYPVATIGGPDYITNVRRALTGLPLVATGNIDTAEIPDYFTAGGAGVGGGGPPLPPPPLPRGGGAPGIPNPGRVLPPPPRPPPHQATAAALPPRERGRPVH